MLSKEQSELMETILIEAIGFLILTNISPRNVLALKKMKTREDVENLWACILYNRYKQLEENPESKFGRHYKVSNDENTGFISNLI